MKSLHWLPIQERIVFKIAIITHKVRLHRQPSYLSNLIVDYIPAWLFRSSDTDLLVVPRTKTQITTRAFCVAAPKIWNNPSCPIRVTTTTNYCDYYRHLRITSDLRDVLCNTAPKKSALID